MYQFKEKCLKSEVEGGGILLFVILFLIRLCFHSQFLFINRKMSLKFTTQPKNTTTTNTKGIAGRGAAGRLYPHTPRCLYLVYFDYLKAAPEGETEK